MNNSSTAKICGWTIINNSQKKTNLDRINSESYVHTLHKKWSFSLRISLVNVIKSAGNFCSVSHTFSIFWFNEWIFPSIYFSIVSSLILGCHDLATSGNVKSMLIQHLYVDVGIFNVERCSLFKSWFKQR